MSAQLPDFGLRWQAKRDTALASTAPDLRQHKAPWPQRSASALQNVLLLLVGFLFIVRITSADNTTNPSLATLAELTRPSKQIPFRDVIAATTHHRVLDFDTNNPAHAGLRQKILKAATLAGERAQHEGISTARANEAGNHMEPFVKAALREAGLHAQTPTNSTGTAQTVGYPDVEITGDTPCYLELKTFNATTADTTQRSFYYSPSEHPKVTHDTLHLLLGYQMEKIQRDGKALFVPVHWRLVTLQDLQVDLKFEFNQSNRGLYGKEASTALLGESEAK